MQLASLCGANVSTVQVTLIFQFSHKLPSILILGLEEVVL